MNAKDYETKITNLLNNFEFLPVNSTLLLDECSNQDDYKNLFEAIRNLRNKGVIRQRNCEGYAIELNK